VDELVLRTGSSLSLGPQTEVVISKQTKEEQKKRELDLELDRELENSFPASDALKITRRSPERQVISEPPVTPKPDKDQTEK
jgi:hypothetical protein